MAVKIGHASIDENGRAKNGSAGDQTGKEVCTRSWYRHRKGWVVLRCKDPEKRNLIAKAMELACANPDIGYDQWQRDTLFNHVKTRGWDPSRTTRKVETDCSALVRVCIAYAYGRDVAGNIRTISEPAMLVKTGLFEKLTAAKYCTSSDYLLRGDILCTPVSGHTVVVLSNGSKVAQGTDTNPTTTTTKEECTVKMQTLKKGKKGNQVKALQALLIGYGYSCGSHGVDGSFGGDTEKAVKAYQKAKGLTVDGSCGPKTWASLLAQ